MTFKIIQLIFIVIVLLETKKLSCPDPTDTVACSSWWEFDVTQFECEARSCCWSPSISVNWCYYPKPAADIKYVHVVQGSHLDVGFTGLVPHVVNTWFHDHFTKAYTVGKQLEQMGNQSNGAQMRYTAQSWIVSLYINCPDNFFGVICPNATELANFKEAVSKDWITWHAFPFNSETEIMDPSLISFGIELTHQLDDYFGKPRKVVMSQRDVPGITRSIIPILRANGVNAISVGSNGGSAPPNVPQAFLWKDPVSGESIKVFFLQGGYGGVNVVPGVFVSTIVPGSANVLVVYWNGELNGPCTSDELIKAWSDLQKEFPGSTIIPSTFEQYFNSLSDVPDSDYPVISAEIGDTWIHGVASDPVKLAQYRTALNLRSECILQKQCDLTDHRFFNFSRLFIKNSEHTWGLDMKSTIVHYVTNNWTNAQFQSIRNTPEMQTLQSSWSEQRQWGLYSAVKALEDHPLAAAIQNKWSQLIATEPSTQGYINFPVSSVPSKQFNCGRFIIGFDTTGSITLLNDTVNNVLWQNSPSGGFAQLEYHTYDQQNYTDFLFDYNYLGPLYNLDDYYDFDKVGINGSTKYRSVVGDLTQFWYLTTASQTQFILKITFPDEIVTLAGSPSTAYILLTVPSTAPKINITLMVFNKTPTRLPEAMFFKFKPSLSNSVWQMQKLGSWMDPLNVQNGGNKHSHVVSSGGVMVNSTSNHHALQFTSEDCPLINFGYPTPFPSPILDPPAIQEGVNYILWDNIWGTNYIMWFPYLPTEQNLKWTYTLNFYYNPMG